MAKSRKLVVEVLGDAKNLGKTFGEISTQTDSLGKKFVKFGAVMGAGITAGVGAAALFGKSALDAAAEAESVQNKVAAIIKATGGAANVTAKQIDKFANRMQYKTGIDDEQIKTSLAMLATFKQVRNEAGEGNKIFNRASKATLDLASVFGSSDAAAKQLGKALSDPVKGIGALKRAGVDFSAAQKEQIEGFVKAGDLLSAQKMILAEVESQVGGTAEASATSGAKMKVAFGELQEKVGGLLLPVFEKFTTFVVEKFIPGLERFWKSVAPKIREWMDKIRERVAPLVEVLGDKLAGAFKSIGNFARDNKAVVATFIGVLAGAAVIASIAALAAGIASLFNPITLIIGALALVAAGAVYAYQHFEGFREVVDSVIEFFKAAWPDIAKVFEAVFLIIKTLFEAYVAYVKFIWSLFGDDLIRIATGIFNVLKGVFDFFLGLFSGDWKRMWDGIVSAARGIGGILSGVLGAAFDAVRTVVVGAFSGLWNGVKWVLNAWIAGWERTINIVLGGVNRLIGAFNRIPGVPNVGKLDMVNLPRLAKGGIVTGPTTALIGEAGPEAVIPLSRAGASGFGGTNITVNVTVSPLASPAETGAAVVDALQAWSRRNGRLPQSLVA